MYTFGGKKTVPKVPIVTAAVPVNLQCCWTLEFYVLKVSVSEVLKETTRFVICSGDSISQAVF